jgi:hypothetical protein
MEIADMLATSSTLGCGLSLYLAFWTAEPQAAEAPRPVVHLFPGWTMVIQPGPVAAKPTGPLKAPATETVSTTDRPPSPAIRLASLSLQRELPPMPSPMPEAVAPALPDESGPAPTVAVASHADRAQSYRAVYNAIPFSRAEYDANPTYRHDATMEFLFGQLRPTVIHRGHTTVTVQQPDNGDIDWSPWVYYGRSGWYAPYPAPGYRVYRGW